MKVEKESIPAKFMRPRPYSRSRGFNWRTCYKYIDDGFFPSYKFQGVVLLDVEECDAILKGLIRHVPKPIKGPGKVGRSRKEPPWPKELKREFPIAIGWQT
jgi:hypothetical protein